MTRVSPSAPSERQHAPGAPGESRAGDLRRIVLEREVMAICDCGRGFVSTGPAASHARRTRHAVTVCYSTRFRFVPLETLLAQSE